MTSSRLRTFADDELMRAPMTMDAAMQATIEALQRGASTMAPGERKVVSDLLLSVAAQRSRLVERYVASLREQVTAELNQQAAARAPRQPKAGSTLSLVDDEAVAIDVVLSHAIETIKSVAEHELREMLAFTSALVGDMDVGADHNPFRAETQARALWSAAQALPLSGGHQVAFMRHAAMPLAQTLRKSYAASCTRLENEGVEPAAYRTLIPPSGPRTRRVLDPSITQPIAPIADSAPPTPSPAGAAPPPETAQPATTEQQLVDLLGRLFGAMLSDRRLPPDMHAAISRVQAFVRKATLEDPTLLERHDHSIWRFVDLLAHLGTVNPGLDGEDRDWLLRFAAKLLDQLSEEPRHTESLYAWAIERLERFAAKRLADRAAQVQEQISTMQELEDRLARADGPISTMHGTIDVPHLDTVPAELLAPDGATAPSTPADDARWVRELRGGQWLRLFHKGRWAYSQLIWPGDRGEIWLFGEGHSDETWAIRRSALQLLRREGLADVVAPRSLIADATTSLVQRRAS